MKPEPAPRASHPNTTNPKWIAGKKIFADLSAGGNASLLSNDEVAAGLFYAKTVMFPARGGRNAKNGLKAEAKKRVILV